MAKIEIMDVIFEVFSTSVDWTQFWPSMVATFVGFVLALLGQFLFERIKSFGNSKQLLKRLEGELRDTETTLESLTSTEIETQPLKTLVWDEATNSGQFSLLKAKKRTELFKIYKQIQEFNSWFEIQTKFYFEHDNQLNEGLKNELTKQRKKLLKMIKDVLPII